MPRRAPALTRRPPPGLSRRDTQSFRLSGWSAAACGAFLLLSVLLAVRYIQGEAVGSGLVVIPLLVALLTPLLKRIAAREPGFDLLGMLYVGLALRFVGAYFRFSSPADSTTYHEVGIELARKFRTFTFVVDTERQVPGTGTVRYVSGLVSIVTGSNFFAEFIVFTLISFFGAVLFIRALAVAFPDSSLGRYSAFIMVWPSLVFWPSSVGKEALMLFTLGVCSYGAARLFTHKRWGVTLLLIGTAGTMMIRPHVALIVLISVAVAELFVRSTSGSVVLSASKILAIVLLLIGGALAATRTAEFLDLDRVSAVDASQALQETIDQTAQGTSEFDAVQASSPLLYPAAAITVLFRPFLFEAHGIEMLVTAAEGAALIALFVLSWRRIIRIPHLVLRQPYVAYALGYVLVFCYAFSVLSNFGILARQRTQVLPLLLVLLCLPLRDRTDDAPEAVGRTARTWRSNVVTTPTLPDPAELTS